MNPKPWPRSVTRTPAAEARGITPVLRGVNGWRVERTLLALGLVVLFVGGVFVWSALFILDNWAPPPRLAPHDATSAAPAEVGAGQVHPGASR
jgi:hypothetical protein